MSVISGAAGIGISLAVGIGTGVAAGLTAADGRYSLAVEFGVAAALGFMGTLFWGTEFALGLARLLRERTRAEVR